MKRATEDLGAAFDAVLGDYCEACRMAPCVCSPARIAGKLSPFLRKIVRRTKDVFASAPEVNGRKVSAALMRGLREHPALVEDGHGFWRRTDLGRQVAAELKGRD